MNRSNETIWPVLIFLGTWWALSTTRLENYAFILAIVLWFVGRSAIKLAGQAVFRLGMRAWWLLGQVAATFAIFLCAVPAEPLHALLVVWGIAVPLVMAGGAAGLLYERFPQARATFHIGAQYALGLTLLLAPFLAWATGFGVLESRAGNLLVAALAAASLYFGWRLAERPARGAHDAHFGNAGDYRQAGMSDER
jgi:hypothetical protein